MVGSGGDVWSVILGQDKGLNLVDSNEATHGK